MKLIGKIEDPNIMGTYPHKTIRVDDKYLKIYGLSTTDSYFTMIDGAFEPEFKRLCDSVLDEDSSCIDLGANIGFKTLIMAMRATKGAVLAVEASPSIVPILELNVAANGFPNVVVAPTAVGGREGKTRFVDSTCWGQVTDDAASRTTLESVANWNLLCKNAQPPSETVVPITTLPNLVRKMGIEKVDFIKMDIEGSEHDVLKNSIDWLKQLQPLVLFEFNSWIQMTNLEIYPVSFLTWVLDNFKYVYVLNKTRADKGFIYALERQDIHEFIHVHMTSDRFYTDLLVTDNEKYAPIFMRLECLDQLPTLSHDFIASLSREMLNEILRGRKVAIKGAGQAAKNILQALDRDIAVKCVLDKRGGGKPLCGIDVVSDDAIHEYDIDTILISSFQYRNAMRADIEALGTSHMIVDIYEIWEKLGYPIKRTAIF